MPMKLKNYAQQKQPILIFAPYNFFDFSLYLIA